MGNSFDELVRILPKSERTWVGTVFSVDAARGISIIDLVGGGGRISASGVDVTAGTNCLVTNGRITQELPSLGAIVDVTIF